MSSYIVGVGEGRECVCHFVLVECSCISLSIDKDDQREE